MKKILSIILTVTMMLTMVIGTNVFASIVDYAVVDVTTPVDGVTLVDGAISPITITAIVSGKQDGTSTFTIYQDWTLTNGVFVGSNPATRTVTPRVANAEPTTYNFTGILTVSGTQPEGTYTLAAKAFNFTNTNPTGAKLGEGKSSDYDVIVDNPEPVDTTPPEITINPYTTTPTNQDITVTASTNEGALNAISHIFTANGSFEFVATDAAGNVTKQTVTITNIDKAVPEITINPYTTTPTNQDVTVTASTNEGTLNAETYTFNKNGTFNFVATDAAGNVTTVPVVITNIDKIAPEITINPYTTTPTNHDVTVTASTNEGTLNAETYTFSENGTFNFVATDDAGNVTTVPVVITNIDKIAPEITINPYTTTPTNQDVTVTASTNEGSLNEVSHTFTANGSFEFVATDAAGNVTKQTVAITNIDKVAPEIAVVDGGIYVLNASFSWTASDKGGSELATAASGTIDTSKVGACSATITATDNAGNTNIKIIKYTVKYDFSGILDPINSTGNSLFKAGSTVPVKFSLQDSDLANVSTATATISYAKLNNTVFGSDIEAVSTSAATTGSAFRYDSTAKQYIFNFSTKGLTSGTYKLSIKLNDGQSYFVQISLK
jgi:hypothetical protein